jgi:hypothetical protein
LLRVLSNEQLDAQQAQNTASQDNDTPLLTGLVGHINRCWVAAREHKQPITKRLLDAQRARMGQYDLEKLGKIQQFGGSLEYARVIANKARTAESWLRDVYLGQAEKAWTLNPTPKPDFQPGLREQVQQQVSLEVAQAFAAQMPPPPEAVDQRLGDLTDQVEERLMEEAREVTARMENKMEDQMVEGGFNLAFSAFISDLVTYPAAHFKAPVLRKEQKLKWVDKGGTWVPEVSVSTTPQFERMDPFRCYPAPGALTPQDGYFIHHITYAREDLYNLIGLPGFKEPAIRAVLEQYGKGGLTNWLNMTEQAWDALGMKPSGDNPNVTIDCLEFHGPVQGRMLKEWDKDFGGVDDLDRDYEVQAWLIGRWVIKAQLNPDPLARRNIYKTCWEELPGSYWGIGLPDALSDVQGILNAAVRALVNNMGMASGPQVGVNVDLLPPGEDLTNVHAWKIWQFNSPQTNGGAKPLEFFQPQSMVQDLLAVIEKFYQFADDFSMVPRYMSGNDRIGGPGRTASGLSMLLNAANKGLKGIVSNIDNNVITPMLERLYNYNMLFDPDPAIKGDASVMARGAVSLMQLETLQLRRNEFLQATANPFDMQIVGLEGRAAVLREVAKGLEMDVNQVVPEHPMQMQQPGMQPGAPGQASPPAPNQETLANGAATTDNFSPNKLRAVS